MRMGTRQVYHSQRKTHIGETHFTPCPLPPPLLLPGTMTDSQESAKREETAEAERRAALRTYYERWYPHEKVWELLELLGRPYPIENREIAMQDTRATKQKLSRYVSFPDWRAARERMSRETPDGLFLGGVHTIPAEDRWNGVFNSKSTFATARRELVMDIDSDDFEMVRWRCNPERTRHHLCPACWPLLVPAARTLDYMVRKQLGYVHILWEFSGGRGLHCWVLDDRAQWLNDDGRQKLMALIYGTVASFRNRPRPDSYRVVPEPADGTAEGSVRTERETNEKPPESPLALYSGDELREQARLAAEDWRWPSHIQELHDRVMFPQLLKVALPSQRVFSDELGRRKLADLLLLPPDDQHPLRSALVGSDEGMWGEGGSRSEEERFHAFMGLVRRVTGDRGYLRRRFACEMALAFCFPPIDVAVSTGFGHLLRLPFSPHSSGRICHPVRLEDLDTFDPWTSAPRWTDLAQADPDVPGTDNASSRNMRTAVSLLEEHVDELLEAARVRRAKRQRGE